MPNHPHFGPSSKKHQPLSTAEETKERLLHQVKDENRRFYESNLEIARNISLLQTGVSEDIARALTRGLVTPPGESAVSMRVKEEKVQSDLYRAVVGNKIYETEFGQDSQHYRRSENVEYMNANAAGKFGRQFMRALRGAGSMIGTNNYFEAAVDRRFGADRNIENRRNFVAERLRNPLTQMQATRPANFTAISTRLGAPATVVAVINTFAQTDFITANEIREWCENVGDPFFNDAGLNDLILLIESENERDNEIGLVSVNDFQGLREFHDTMLGMGGQPEQLMRRIEQTVENGSLFPLETNPEGRIFLANIRSQYNLALAEAIRAALPNPQDVAAGLILADLTAIRDTELEEAPQTQPNLDLIADVNRLIGELRPGRQKLVASFTSLNRLARDIAAERRRITGPPALTGNDLKNANTRINNWENQQNTTIAEHANLEIAYQDVFRNLRNRLNPIPGRPTIPPIIVNALGLPLTPEANLRVEIPAALPPTGYEFYDHLRTSTVPFGDLIDTEIPTDFLRLLTNRVRLDPYRLLQRFLRRDYLRERNLQMNIFSEEANKWAEMKASLRLAALENADTARSASNKAAEFLNKGIASRGESRIRSGIAGVQNAVGLELFDIKIMTAGSLIEQIINSNADFHVFRGINKFTTTRDLRAILNASGKKVSPVVVERFTLTLAEAISQYKAVLPELQTELEAGDWDMETMIGVLQQFKKETWLNQRLERLQAEGGNKEHAYIRIMREGREEEKRVSAEILADVRHEDAMWRKLLRKDELKKVLSKDIIEGTNKLKEAGIASRNKEISRMRAKANLLPENSPTRKQLELDIVTQQASIDVINRQIADSKDLYERVEDAKKYIAENKLSRAQKKEYLAQTGLTQVFDKMGTNFRFQRYWAATKRGAKWTGGKIKAGWSWSRKKFLNAETAKSFGKKSFSVLRMAATPITTPLGWAWKAGTFPLRLTGRAMVGTVRLPGRFWRMMSKSAKRNWLRERRLIVSEEFQNIASKQARLQSRMLKVPYSWDKRRILRQINKLEEDKIVLNEQMNDLGQVATKAKIPFDTIGFGSVAANDNAAVKTPVPTEAPKTIKKAA